MATTISPDHEPQLSDSDAEALFEEARELERRRRRRRVGSGVVAAVVLAAGIGFGMAGGGGGGSIPTHRAPFSNGLVAASSQPQDVRTETVAMSSSICSLASRPAAPGNPPRGQCVTTLPNGREYRCPIAVQKSFGANQALAETNHACSRTAPPSIPVSWRPTVRRMNGVKACLKQAGFTASGSTMPPAALRAYPDTPIAAVLIAGTSGRPTTVSFYRSTAKARQAYARYQPTIKKDGEGMARYGQVLYTWGNRSAGQATAERGCIHAA